MNNSITKESIVKAPKKDNTSIFATFEFQNKTI